jgi:hypothetical protein
MLSQVRKSNSFQYGDIDFTSICVIHTLNSLKKHRFAHFFYWTVLGFSQALDEDKIFSKLTQLI